MEKLSNRLGLMLAFAGLFILAGCLTASRVERTALPAQPPGTSQDVPTSIVTVVPATAGAAPGATPATPPAGTVGPQQNFAFRLAWSPGGDWLAAATFDGLRLYDPLNGSEKAVLSPGVECCIDYAVGNRLLSAVEPRGEWVKTWVLSTQQLLYTLEKGQQPFDMLALSPDEATLAASQPDGIYLWNAENGELLAQMPAGERYSNMALIADSRTLVAASSYTSKVQIWDLESHELASTLDFDQKVVRFTIHPDGSLLAVDYGLNGFELWELPAGRKTSAVPEAVGAPGSLAFSPDKRLAAVWGYNTAGETGCAAIWDLESKERLNQICLGVLTQHMEWRGAAFSPDASQLALSDDRGNIIIFDVNSGEAVREIKVTGD